jgi:8-oxo-dGTP pyrophosphatase MutT (NUDIX family)
MMPNPIHVESATLCPVRIKDDDLEVLLVRRNFWDYQNNRPMIFPGEWVFSGGKKEENDKSLLETAIREFCEETRYEGVVSQPKLIYSGKSRFYDRIYNIDYYAARIDDSAILSFEPKGEVVEARWFSPSQAIELLRSESFEKQQAEEFHRQGLDKPSLGDYVVEKRIFPRGTVHALETIRDMAPDLISFYEQQKNEQGGDSHG